MAKKTTKKATKRTATKAKRAAGELCACGCGKRPLGKRSVFIQGHDAKLHSLRLKVKRGEVKVGALSAGVRAALRK